MVLLDDNFATIVTAVKEGRRVYDGIRRFIKYTMTSNSGEIWTLLLAPLVGLPIPLLPIQILWINLLTDGLPGLALAAEPAEPDIMRRPPRPPKENIFAGGMWPYVLGMGLLIGVLSVTVQGWGVLQGIEHWQTLVFTTLVIAQLFQSLAIRSDRESLFSLGVASNTPLLLAIAITVVAQLAVIYVPVLNPIFHTAPLSFGELSACVGLGAIVLVVSELHKSITRRGDQSATAPNR